jgi:RNA polymerase-binding transcription factor DksA
VKTVEITDTQRRTLKNRLEQRFYELREQLRKELLASDEQHYIDLAGLVHDTGEASVADLLEDVELATVDRHIDEIRDIDAALLCIAHGTYGTCIDCEGPIESRRLEAQPTARRCHTCQTKLEDKPVSGAGRGPSL